jgi:hexokinase
MFLGEITRNIITHLIDQFPPILFGGNSTQILNKLGGLTTENMANIENAKSLVDVKRLLEDELEFESGVVSDQDAEIVRWAYKLVGNRAAKLSGCAIAAVLIHSGEAQLASDGKRRLQVVADGTYVT